VKVYYLAHTAKPTASSPHYKTLKAAYVNTWVVSENAKQATLSAAKNIRSCQWEVVSLEQEPIETTLEDCPSPEAESQFLKARQIGIATVFAAAGIDESGKYVSSN